MLDPTTILGALLWAGVFFVLAAGASWLIGRMIRNLTPDASDESDANRRIRLRFILQLIRIGVFLIFFILWAHLVPALRSFATALLASASVLSIVLGIAAQNTLGNVIAGVSILAYRPFGVGDRIQIAAPTGLEVGVVESINLSHTVLATYDNRRITVPNGLVMNETLINLTAEDARVMALVSVGVEYGTDIPSARQILRDLAEQHPDVLSVDAIPVTQLGPSSVVITARLWCPDAGTAKQVEFDLYESILRAFSDAGISIPYPWSNVIVHHPTGTDEPVAARMEGHGRG